MSVVPDHEFVHRPLDGGDVERTYLIRQFGRPAAGEGDVGDVVRTFEVGNRTERVDESLVKSKKAGTLDGEIDHRTGAANRLLEPLDAVDARRDGRCAGERSSRPRRQSVVLGRLEALTHQRVALPDALEADETWVEVRSQPLHATGNRHVEAVHDRTRRAADMSVVVRAERIVPQPFCRAV